MRVVLLDLRLHDDGFVGDHGLVDVARLLSGEGASARVLRAESDGGIPDQVRADLNERPCDVLVLARAWDQGLLEQLRTVAPDAALVRLGSQMTPAPLDELFDAVVDEAQLRDLVAGRGEDGAFGWLKRSARDVREDRAKRSRAIADVAVDVRDLTRPRRPTISGPAGGCPYLRDSANEPVFAELGLDPEKVQTRGCSFCLDNVGAYAAVSTDETVGVWLEQLAKIRASTHPSGGNPEVLLTDERPHPHLATFFRRLAEDTPELAPVDLMIKSRVDWLIEHRDAVSEAAREAARTGSVVHIYLMGFENFDPWHLSLFNKGHDVQASEQAMEVLRELEREHGAAFEFRRHRAHGIVLFTPWTTPDALLTNARAMRRLGFHEFRSDALRTRLRLYPRTPLYHLAERDGLLADEFDDARPDRASEQGYDASFAWRFADPRVEAIFAAAIALSRATPNLLDADALEAATHFVVRWPTLGERPDLAAAALVALGRAPADAPAAWRAFDRELEALRAGDKRAALREGVSASDVDTVIAAFETMGFASAVVSRHGSDAAGDHREGTDHAIVAIARDAATLDEVLEAQRAVERGDGEAIGRVGALMGYPTCCREAFARRLDRRDNWANELAPFRRARATALHVLLNRFARVRLCSHHICRPDCAPSIALAEADLGRLAEIDPDAAGWVRARLERPRVAAGPLHNAWLRRVTATDAGVKFEAHDPDARWLPEGSTGAGVDENGLELHGPAGAQLHRIASESPAGPIIVLPGAPALLPIRPHARRVELSSVPCEPRCVSCVGCGPRVRDPDAAARAMRALDARTVELDGGDVLAWGHLDEICEENTTRDEPAKLWITAPARALDPHARERLKALGVHGVVVHVDAAGAKMLARFRAPDPMQTVEDCESAGLAVRVRISVKPASFSPLLGLARKLAPRPVELELDWVDFDRRPKPTRPHVIELALRASPNVTFSRRLVTGGFVPPCLTPELYEERPRIWPSMRADPPNRTLPACIECSRSDACGWADPQSIEPEALARARPIPALPPRRTATRRPVPAAIRRVRSEQAERGRAPIVCATPWTTMEIVDPDGAVRQCCAEWTLGDRGDARANSLSQLWNGPGYQRARAQMLGEADGDLCAPICPRLHDRTLSERAFRIQDGSEAFVRNQLQIAEDIAERRTTTTAKPLYLSVCPSTYCNYDCIMCTYGRTARRDLDDAIWEELPGLWPTLRSLTLLGGEPLANPTVMQTLHEFDARRWPDASIDVITNGSLLTEKNLRRMEHCSFGSIVVSINAGDAETYETVQRGIPFDDILANLRALQEHRRRSHRWFHVNLSFVLQPTSIHTLIPFGELARSLGFGIRLMALNIDDCPELDFYGDPEAVHGVLAEGQRFVEWAASTRPEWIVGARAALDGVRATADARASGAGVMRLPVVR